MAQKKYTYMENKNKLVFLGLFLNFLFGHFTVGLIIKIHFNPWDSFDINYYKS